MKIRNFTDLDVWKEAHKLVLLIYKITEKFPESEKFGLTNQLRRACVSITSNIAEGFCRRTNKEKIQFYRMSLGSLAEVENQLIIARDISFLTNRDFDEIFGQTVLVGKLISGFIKSAKSL